MGLATSQVRLLALTSRKADVEMQIQLNSKRKTMITRESTELAKLYYAKLQNSKIQYSTTNGYKDVTYNYLMGNDSPAFFYDVASNGAYGKSSPAMILTDTYGRVILNDTMLQTVLDTINMNNPKCENMKGYGAKYGTVQAYTIDAMNEFLKTWSTKVTSGADQYDFIKALYGVFDELYTPKKNESGEIVNNTGYDMLLSLYTKGAPKGGTIYRKQEGSDYKYYSDSKCTQTITPEQGTFYQILDPNGVANDFLGAGYYMYWPGNPKDEGGFYRNTALSITTAEQLCKMFDYYGCIFSAAFNGSQSVGKNDGSASEIVPHLNVALLDGDVVFNTSTKKYEKKSNSVYNTAANTDNLQAGLKSGVYQLVDVSSKETGAYAKAHGLDYFKTLNYVVERADTDQRESVTAWYNAAKADLNEKESYWDSEITALSAELNIITTEIESVKSLRKDAIDSTFKWGAA